MWEKNCGLQHSSFLTKNSKLGRLHCIMIYQVRWVMVSVRTFCQTCHIHISHPVLFCDLISWFAAHRVFAPCVSTCPSSKPNQHRAVPNLTEMNSSCKALCFICSCEICKAFFLGYPKLSKMMFGNGSSEMASTHLSEASTRLEMLQLCNKNIFHQLCRIW